MPGSPVCPFSSSSFPTKPTYQSNFTKLKQLEKEQSLFHKNLSEMIKEDNSDTNKVLLRQNFRNQIAGALFYGKRGHFYNSTANLAPSNRFERKQKWNKWVNSEPKYLNALIKKWEEDYKEKPFLSRALRACVKFICSVIYYPVQWTMQLTNAALRATSTSNSYFTRIHAVRVFKHFESNPKDAENFINAVGQDLQEQEKLLNQNLPEDAKLQKIKEALQSFSTFALDKSKSNEEDIQLNTLNMLNSLLICIEDEQDKNEAKKYIRDILSSTNTLTNEIDILPEDKEELLRCFITANKEFTELLFKNINTEDESQQIALSIEKYYVSQHISNAVLMASYHEKKLLEKFAMWFYRSTSPILTIISKVFGLLGSVAATTSTFGLATTWTIFAFTILGVAVATKIIFFLAESAAIALWCFLAGVVYDMAKNSIIGSTIAQTSNMLKHLKIEEFDKNTNQKRKEIEKKKRQSSTFNKIRGWLSSKRDLKPGLVNRLSPHKEDKADKEKAKKLDAFIKEIDKTILDEIPGYKFIQLVDSGTYKKDAPSNKYERANYRANLIATNFFDEIITYFNENKSSITANEVHSIYELINTCHVYSNMSDDMSEYHIEQLSEKIEHLSQQISKNLMSLKIPVSDTQESEKIADGLIEYYAYNINFFAKILTNNLRSAENKAYRYASGAILPGTNSGVLGIESVVIVDKMQHQELSPFAEKNLLAEFGVGGLLGGVTLGIAAMATINIREKAMKMDKLGIYKPNNNTQKYIDMYNQALCEKRTALLDLAQALQAQANSATQQARNSKQTSTETQLLGGTSSTAVLGANEQNSIKYSIKSKNETIPKNQKINDVNECLNILLKEQQADKYLTITVIEKHENECLIEFDLISSLIEQDKDSIRFPITDCEISRIRRFIENDSEATTLNLTNSPSYQNSELSISSTSSTSSILFPTQSFPSFLFQASTT